MRTFIYSHNQRSQGARALARALGVQRLSHIRTRYADREGDVIINWGSTELPQQIGPLAYVFNRPVRVAHACDKLSAFVHMQHAQVPIPNYVQTRAEATELLRHGTVVCRTLLRASEGRGIVLASTPAELVDAPLYVQYIKKSAEYRVHVVNGQVIDLQQKRRRRDAVEINNQIRNFRNGWVYTRDNVNVPASASTAAISAVRSLSLDFGAVDIIYNRHYNAVYVLEVNTAPGLEGATVNSYANSLRTYLEVLRT